jgi:hypothetical protein
MQPTGSRGAKLSSVGMLFAPAVRAVRVTLAGGRSKTIALPSLSPRQARDSGLGRLRYTGFVIHGTWCVERLVSLSAARRALWDSGTDEYDCPG